MADESGALNKFMMSTIAFVVVVIVLTVSGLIINEFGDSTKTQFKTTITDDQFTATNGTEIFLSNDDIISVDLIENSTNGVELGATNYTVTSSSGGVLLNLDGDSSTGSFQGFEGHTLNVTYTLFEKGAWYNATKIDGANGIKQFSVFLPTIAVVLAAAALIMIVVGAFIFFRARRE